MTTTQQTQVRNLGSERKLELFIMGERPIDMGLADMFDSYVNLTRGKTISEDYKLAHEILCEMFRKVRYG
ncbi:MAG: hypothetical protein Q8L29_00430 [archaeon]|nr:hypothetical protein [archaeon]